MTEIVESPHIAGVKIVRLQGFQDDRGRFVETFRKSWFPERTWESFQTNRSDSRAGVLRGLHYHFRQIDYWCLTRGRIRVGLADLRRTSPTFGQSEVVELDADDPRGVFIPSGVAHGFYALTDATLTYIVDNYYDNSDELGVAWDDPDLAVPWQVTAPTLSPRDLSNPRLRDISGDRMP
jgi:dTDP-4-dehydrorhamnose 3,5-epimerase